jgi:hypothetical protein
MAAFGWRMPGIGRSRSSLERPRWGFYTRSGGAIRCSHPRLWGCIDRSRRKNDDGSIESFFIFQVMCKSNVKFLNINVKVALLSHFHFG